MKFLKSLSKIYLIITKKQYNNYEQEMIFICRNIHVIYQCQLIHGVTVHICVPQNRVPG